MVLSASQSFRQLSLAPASQRIFSFTTCTLLCPRPPQLLSTNTASQPTPKYQVCKYTRGAPMNEDDIPLLRVLGFFVCAPFFFLALRLGCFFAFFTNKLSTRIQTTGRATMSDARTQEVEKARLAEQAER